MMTWLSVNHLPMLAGAKWPIASHPALLCRLSDAAVHTFTCILVQKWGSSSFLGILWMCGYKCLRHKILSNFCLKLLAIIGLFLAKPIFSHNTRVNGPFWHYFSKISSSHEPGPEEIWQNKPLVFSQHHRLGTHGKKINFKFDTNWNAKHFMSHRD